MLTRKRRVVYSSGAADLLEVSSSICQSGPDLGVCSGSARQFVDQVRGGEIACFRIGIAPVLPIRDLRESIVGALR